MEEKTSGNPYGRRGGETAKQIIDRVVYQNFKKTNKEPYKKSIGEMEDELIKLVYKHVKFIE